MKLFRLFLAFFILLQGVSPLLHAHADSGQHGGAHLPAGLPVHGLAEGIWLQDGSHSHQAVEVAESMKTRRIASVSSDSPCAPVFAPALFVPQVFASACADPGVPAASSDAAPVPPARAPPRG